MKNRYILLLVVFVTILTNSPLDAQFYVTGESPARAKWNQINTANYKVIYPQGVDSLAFRYASLLESERGRVMSGILANPKQVPVILHPYTTISNGMVVWAPKRMELYTRPPASNDYYQNWERQLVLHESRHVGQISHFTKGVYRPLGWFLGEQISGLGVGVFASKWLLEGDAVVAETELTNGGRGRSASFMEHYRVSMLSNEPRSWHKWRYGCYKHYTPNVYALGYVINSTARLKSGNYLYSGELLNSYVKHFYNPNIVNTASKKLVGARPRDLFKEGLENHAKMWREEYEHRKPYTESQIINHKQSTYYYEYQSLVEVNKDTVVCIKYSYDTPAALVMLSSDKRFLEQHKHGEALIRPFSSSTSALELIGRKIFWTESVADARWGKESFNNLYLYDLDTKLIEQLSKNTSYNNPTANDSGDLLSVIEYPLEGGSNLVILDAATGRRVASHPAPENGQITESVWLNGRFYSLVVTERGLGMFSKSCDGDGCWESVIAEQPKAIRSLGVANGKLYFESDIDGVNNIYEFDPNNEELNRIVNSQFGLRDPHIAGDRVYYSSLYANSVEPCFSLLGDTVAKKKGDPFIKEGRLYNDYKFEVADKLTQQANEYFASKADESQISADGATKESAEEYQVKRYRKGTHLFRFHSWAPVYYNVDRIMSMSFDHFYDVMALGATAYSQNSLGTAVTMLGYSFREGHHAAHASFEYSGLLPVFKLVADYNTTDRYKYRVKEENDTIKMSVGSDGKPLLSISLQAYVPINLSSHGWQRGLIPQVVWQYDNDAFYNNKKRDYTNRQQVTYSLRYYQMRPIAHAAIFPKWGFSATVSGEFSPNGGENFGSALSFYSYLYMPGFMKRQGIRLSASYQKQFIENKWMYLDNLVSMPRGHDDHYGAEYYKFTADYAVPVNLKGFSLGFLAYFKRLQVIPFVDVARLKSAAGKWSDLHSYGADLLLDAVICHIDIPFSIGVRYARTNDPEQKNYFGFLSSISLF